MSFLFGVYPELGGEVSRLIDVVKIEDAEIDAGDGELLILLDEQDRLDGIAGILIVTSEGVLARKDSMSLAVSSNIITANGVDEAIISGIPAGSVVSFGGSGIAVPSGVVEFSIDAPGTYQLVFSNPIYLNTTVEIVAT